MVQNDPGSGQVGRSKKIQTGSIDSAVARAKPKIKKVGKNKSKNKGKKK